MSCLNAKLTDEVYHLVKNVAKVTGFLGQNNKPMPLRQGEVDRILNQASESAVHPKSTITFEIGEQVRVADGPFTSFTGTVEEVDEDRSSPEGGRFDLRPRHPGGAGIYAGRKDVSECRQASCRKGGLDGLL